MKCPGQDSRYWKQGAIFEVNCPKCDHPVEFFKDDTSRKCGNCGHRFVNPKMDFGCAAYCQFAEQCLGTLPPELVAQQENFLKDRVALEMKKYFGRDFKRIGHAGRVARYAERIGKDEKGNLAVILCAAYLHDIGIYAAEKKHNSTAAEYRETEGPPVAKEILVKLGAKPKLIDAVCAVIAHHPQDGDDIDFKVVFDADRIATLEEQLKDNPIAAEKRDRLIDESFLTESGRKQARSVLAGQAGSKG